MADIRNKNNKRTDSEKSEKALVRTHRKDEIDLTYDLPAQAKTQKSIFAADSGKRAGAESSEYTDPYELADYKNVRVVTTKKKKKRPFPFAITFTAVALTCMLFFLMMNYATLDKATTEIAAMNSQLATLKRNEQTLNKLLNERDDLKLAEEYAQNTLNMVKADELPSENIESVKTVKPDKSNVIEYDSGDSNKVRFVLSGIVRVFSGFFGGKS